MELNVWFFVCKPCIDRQIGFALIASSLPTRKKQSKPKPTIQENPATQMGNKQACTSVQSQIALYIGWRMICTPHYL